MFGGLNPCYVNTTAFISDERQAMAGSVIARGNELGVKVLPPR